MKKANFSAYFRTFIAGFIFWMLITGQIVSIFTGTASVQIIIAGVIVSLLASLFSARFFVEEEKHSFWKRLPGFIYYYLIVFPWELIKANFSLAFKVLNPKLNIRPGIVKVPVDVKSDYGMAALADSITLTPGTITMDIAEDEEGKNWFYIHWVDVEEEDPDKAGEAIKGTLERGVRKAWK